jgi:prepilin-type N-terminal cleavage/methylation domain-containing protein
MCSGGDVLMKRKMSGYTLVELMVALVLGLIVVLVAVQMLLAGQRSVAFQNAVLNVQDNANIGLNYIVTDLKHTNLNLINRFIYDNGNSVYEYKCTQNFIEDDWGAENYGQEYTYQIIFNKDENNKLVCDLTAYNYDMDILYNAKNHKSIIANNFLNYCKQVKTT